MLRLSKLIFGCPRLIDTIFIDCLLFILDTLPIVILTLHQLIFLSVAAVSLSRLVNQCCPLQKVSNSDQTISKHAPGTSKVSYSPYDHQVSKVNKNS